MVSGRDVVLVLNCGSSSVKLAVIDPDTGERPVAGLAERVGTADASVRLTVDGEREEFSPTDSSHRGVLRDCLDRLLAWSAEAERPIAAVGHRVVHGGTEFTESARIDDAMLVTLQEMSPLAPLHNPANIAGIDAASAELPVVPQVAVFDTAFHSRMPGRAYRYAVPEQWHTDFMVRRYGFHGTSHQYVSDQAAVVLGRPLSELRLVTAHLGNGCSIAAVRAGVSVDTSMGLTPLEGLVMGTRSGDVDAGIIDYLTSVRGLPISTVLAALNSDSGLLGLSGVSNDMRTLRERAAEGHVGARLALDVFCYRLAKYIAAYQVPLGGLDAIVFTGGIGENDATTRSEVLALLGFLGVQVDENANAAPPRRPGRVITEPGPVAALVVPTDEELVIARESVRLLHASTVGAQTASPGGNSL